MWGWGGVRGEWGAGEGVRDWMSVGGGEKVAHLSHLHVHVHVHTYIHSTHTPYILTAPLCPRQGVCGSGPGR